MSEIYKNLKKGHKISISTDINNACRSYAFSNGWDTTDEIVAEITLEALNNYFADKALMDANDEEKGEFTLFIKDKVENAFKEFASQKPTARQIYYYVDLCLEHNEKPSMLMTNKEIWYEINRLKSIKYKEYEIEEQLRNEIMNEE